MLWYKRIKESKDSLENHIENINEMISKFNVNANQFKQQFPDREAPKHFNHLNNFEEYEIAKGYKGVSNVPQLQQVNDQYTQLLQENKRLNDKIQNSPGIVQPDDDLKQELGPLYGEYQNMVEDLKTNIKRVNQQAKNSVSLPIKIQHVYQYSKWDSINEPYNVVENILRDDDTQYKALQPNLDLNLSNSLLCYVAEILIWPGDVGPLTVEVFVSNHQDSWTFVKEYTCARDIQTKLTMPGEYICKFVRVLCKNNTRGGNIVAVRHIKVLGLH